LNENYTTFSVLNSVLWGAARGFILLPGEHPFDRVKAVMQANEQGSLGVNQTIRQLVKERGIWTLWEGIVPGIAKSVVKQGIRFPMILFIPPLFDSHIPKKWQETFPCLKNLSAGFAISLVETTVLAPFDRWRVSKMTGGSLKESINSLFAGSKPYYARQAISWATWLVCEEKFKQFAKKYTECEELSIYSLISVSMGISVVNTAVTLPPDRIKTLLQKPNPTLTKKLWPGLCHVVKTQGLRSLWVGWQLRLGHSVVSTLGTVYLLQKFRS